MGWGLPTGVGPRPTGVDPSTVFFGCEAGTAAAPGRKTVALFTCTMFTCMLYPAVQRSRHPMPCHALTVCPIHAQVTRMIETVAGER